MRPKRTPEAAALRALISAGYTHKQIAEMHGVTRAAVSQLVKRSGLAARVPARGSWRLKGSADKNDRAYAAFGGHRFEDDPRALRHVRPCRKWAVIPAFHSAD